MALQSSGEFNPARRSAAARKRQSLREAYKVSDVDFNWEKHNTKQSEFRSKDDSHCTQSSDSETVATKDEFVSVKKLPDTLSLGEHVSEFSKSKENSHEKSNKLLTDVSAEDNQTSVTEESKIETIDVLCNKTMLERSKPVSEASVSGEAKEDLHPKNVDDTSLSKNKISEVVADHKSPTD